jgi:hypothetical protein
MERVAGSHPSSSCVTCSCDHAPVCMCPLSPYHGCLFTIVPPPSPQVNCFTPHTAPVQHLSFDDKAEYIASTCHDSSVAVSMPAPCGAQQQLPSRTPGVDPAPGAPNTLQLTCLASPFGSLL